MAALLARLADRLQPGGERDAHDSVSNEGSIPGHNAVVDLREEDAILRYLTNKSGPPAIRITSFSGETDRVYP